MNRVYLEGGMAKEPDVRTTQTGKMVAKFSIAVKDKIGQNEETTWVDIVAWNKLAEATDGLGRGSQVMVAGRLTKRKWEKNDGTTQYFTEVVADRIIPLSPKKVKTDAPFTADDFGNEVPY